MSRARRAPTTGAHGRVPTRSKRRERPQYFEAAVNGPCVAAVGALLALKAFYVDGIPANEALEFGKQHGLTRMEAATRRVMEQGR